MQARQKALFTSYIPRVKQDAVPSPKSQYLTSVFQYKHRRTEVWEEHPWASQGVFGAQRTQLDRRFPAGAVLLPAVSSESRDRLLQHQLCWSVEDLPLCSLLQHHEARRGSQTPVLCSLPCPLLEGSVGRKGCAWEGPDNCCRKRGKEQQLSGPSQLLGAHCKIKTQVEDTLSPTQSSFTALRESSDGLHEPILKL